MIKQSTAQVVEINVPQHLIPIRVFCVVKQDPYIVGLRGAIVEDAADGEGSPSVAERGAASEGDSSCMIKLVSQEDAMQTRTGVMKKLLQRGLASTRRAINLISTNTNETARRSKQWRGVQEQNVAPELARTTIVLFEHEVRYTVSYIYPTSVPTWQTLLTARRRGKEGAYLSLVERAPIWDEPLPKGEPRRSSTAASYL